MVSCFFRNESLRNEKGIKDEYQPRFLNNGGRGFFDRGKKAGKRRGKADRIKWFPERTREVKPLIRLIRRDSSGSENWGTGRGHLRPDSQTLD